jgi:hypothetical protein
VLADTGQQQARTARMAGIKTRHSSDSKLSEYLGSGKELLISELPTLRAALRQGIKFQEDRVTAKTNYPDKELTLDVARSVENQWLKANSELVSPKVISLKSLQRSLEKDWKKAKDIVWKRLNKKSEIATFEARLDKLLDISKCRCEIQLCAVKPPCEESKAGKKCKQGAHISCSCPREEKLPKLELLFIYKQREKTEEIGGMHTGRPDFPESTRQATYLVRKQAEEQGKAGKG